jgi:hypothetical protein
LAAFLLAWGGAQARAAETLGIVCADGRTADLTRETLSQLAPTHLAVEFETMHGAVKSEFDGPTLWAVLDRAGCLPGKMADAVRQIVIATGDDGYTAILALGEISPEFEAKTVLLATSTDGKPQDHWRLVVPADKRGGRSVRDVIRIAVQAPVVR